MSGEAASGLDLSVLWMRGHVLLHGRSPAGLAGLSATDTAAAFAAIPPTRIVPLEQWAYTAGLVAVEPQKPEPVDNPAEAVAAVMGASPTPLFNPATGGPIE